MSKPSGLRQLGMMLRDTRLRLDRRVTDVVSVLQEVESEGDKVLRDAEDNVIGAIAADIGSLKDDIDFLREATNGAPFEQSPKPLPEPPPSEPPPTQSAKQPSEPPAEGAFCTAEGEKFCLDLPAGKRCAACIHAQQ